MLRPHLYEEFTAMTAKTILFLAYGGGHAHALVPVVKLLQQMQVKCVLLGISTGALTFRRAGLECLDFTDLVPEQFRKLVETYGTELLAGNHNPSSGLTREQSIAYLGLNYLDIVRREGEEKAGEFFSTQGRRCFLPLETMESLIEDTKPDLVVTSISPRTELAARIVANRRGIKSLAVADTANPVLQDNSVLVDTLCIPNEISRASWMDMACVKTKRIVVTGNPAYDHFSEVPKMERTSVLFCQQVCKFNTGKGKWENFEEKDFFEHFDRWSHVADALDVPCEVRLHPTADKNIFSKWKAARRRNLELDVEPYSAISLASRKVVIGNFSTILTEALYLETPVVQYLYEGEIDTIDRFVELGIVKSVGYDDVEGLVKVTNQAAAGEIDFSNELRRFRAQYPPPPAALKVVEQILSLV